MNSLARARLRGRASLSAHSMARPSLVAAAGIIIGGLTLGSALAQQPGATSTVGDLDGRPAIAISLIDRSQLAPGLAEIRVGTAGVDAATNRLLALSPDGGMAAVASHLGPEPATLMLARRDGTQLRAPLTGLIGAGFSPDGTWLAALDGSGAAWRISTATATAVRIAEGPFLGSPIVEPDGSLIALRVSSVEAPISSRLVRIGTDGVVSFLADEQLVYSAERLADGTIAYVAHRAAGTYVMRLSDGRSMQLADLGQDAVNVSLAPAADAVAYERAGALFLRGISDSAAVPLGTGSRPRFAPDGRTVLIERGTGSALLARDGRQLGAFEGQASFASCDGECGQ